MPHVTATRDPAQRGKGSRAIRVRRLPLSVRGRRCLPVAARARRPGRARAARCAVRPRARLAVGRALAARDPRRPRGTRARARVGGRRHGDGREPVLLGDRGLPAVRALLVPADLHVPARARARHRGSAPRDDGGEVCASARRDRRRLLRLPLPARALPRAGVWVLHRIGTVHGAIDLGVRVRLDSAARADRVPPDRRAAPPGAHSPARRGRWASRHA